VTIELSPRLPDDERPSEYASLAAEDVDLDNVINELLLRLADHNYRWELYEFGLTDAAERRRVRAIIGHLQLGCTQAGRPRLIRSVTRCLRLTPTPLMSRSASTAG
jgi:hypothetical protein